MIRAPTFKSSTLRLISSLFPVFKLRKLSLSAAKTQNMAAVHSITAAASAATNRRGGRMKKVVVVMGPTGSGKSKLSIDLATRFFPSSEIINSDKIQIYRGLDITTNKISMHDRRGVPHHLLGEFDQDTEFTPSDFRSRASKTIAGIISRRNVPILVGGSNSFIHALLAKKYSPESGDVFDESVCNAISSELRYNCCFIWVDVGAPVLNQYLDVRVDEMMQSGMLEELSEYFAAAGSGGDSVSQTRVGLRKAIGVPEFERYFENGKDDNEVARIKYEGAARAIKENTWQLAKKQVGKIVRLRDAGWDLHKVDATEAFRAAMVTSESGKRASEMWEKMVVEPSVKIVSRFLME